jgi:two-component system, chemotaxis family, response regulator Rcp1
MQNCVILHVENDDATAFLFRAALDEVDLSVSVYRVCDGEQALAFLTRSGAYGAARRPELVILDLHLPKVDGWEVLSELQARDDLRSIPMVVLGTSCNPQDADRALLLGARQFVPKPRSFDELVRGIEKIARTFVTLRRAHA